MKTLSILAVAAIAAGSLSSCNSKAAAKKKYREQCETMTAAMLSDAKYKDALNAYCDCSTDKMLDKYSVKELEAVEKSGAATMQAQVSAVVQPCVDELQRKVSGTGAGGSM